MKYIQHLFCLICAALLAGSPAAAQLRRPQAPDGLAPATGRPVPTLIFAGRQTYQVSNRTFVRYWFDVLNKWEYPNEMFAAAPQLPPCGSNTNASRTWVDFFNRQGRRLYGFCALNQPAGLGMIWFALPEGEAPPAQVYIEMKDRQTNTLYRSGLAPTSR